MSHIGWDELVTTDDTLLFCTIRPDEGTDPSFVCERVCTSDRLLRRMGGLSKDPTPNTCVTVCGVGGTPILFMTSKVWFVDAQD